MSMSKFFTSKWWIYSLSGLIIGGSIGITTYFLFKTIKNLFKLIKILKGDKLYLYSNGIDITGYCLDSLQRFFGKKFTIEKENSFSNINKNRFFQRKLGTLRLLKKKDRINNILIPIQN